MSRSLLPWRQLVAFHLLALGIVVLVMAVSLLFRATTVLPEPAG